MNRSKNASDAKVRNPLSKSVGGNLIDFQKIKFTKQQRGENTNPYGSD